MPQYILLEASFEKWTLLGPEYNFGRELSFDSSAPIGEDRRYKKICTIDGDLQEATKYLHQFERGHA